MSIQLFYSVRKGRYNGGPVSVLVLALQWSCKLTSDSLKGLNALLIPLTFIDGTVITSFLMR